MPRKSQRELEAPPPVRLVEPVLPVELPAPPPHLSLEAADWWRQTVAAYELEPHHLKILEERCGGGAGSSTGNTGSTSRTGGGASSSRWDLRGMVHLYAPPTRISELPATGKGRNQSPVRYNQQYAKTA